jgi:hypothetical protein
VRQGQLQWYEHAKASRNGHHEKHAAEFLSFQQRDAVIQMNGFSQCGTTDDP